MLGKAVHMPTTPPIEPPGRPSSVFAKLRSVLRGDKYMVDAYPPGDARGSAPAASPPKEG